MTGYDMDRYHDAEEAASQDRDYVNTLKDNIAAEFPNADRDTITIQGPEMAALGNPIGITSTISGVRVEGCFYMAGAHLFVDRHEDHTYYMNFEPHNHYLTREAATLLYIVMVVWAKAS